MSSERQLIVLWSTSGLTAESEKKGWIADAPPIV